MARVAGWGERKGRLVTVTVDHDDLAWVDAHVGESRLFSSRSHAFRRALRELREREENPGETKWPRRP